MRQRIGSGSSAASAETVPGTSTLDRRIPLTCTPVRAPRLPRESIATSWPPPPETQGSIPLPDKGMHLPLPIGRSRRRDCAFDGFPGIAFSVADSAGPRALRGSVQTFWRLVDDRLRRGPSHWYICRSDLFTHNIAIPSMVINWYGGRAVGISKAPEPCY